MARIRARSWFSIGAVAVGFFGGISGAQSGQQIPGFLDIFGGLINTAIVDAARGDWQTRPLSDYNCLARHGVSADQLANRGIGPEDPRVRQILSQCAFAAPAPVPVAPQPARGLIAGPPNPNYVVNGLALGAPFSPQPDLPARTVALQNDLSFELHLCRNSSQPAEKLEHCSNRAYPVDADTNYM